MTINDFSVPEDVRIPKEFLAVSFDGFFKGIKIGFFIEFDAGGCTPPNSMRCGDYTMNLTTLS